MTWSPSAAALRKSKTEVRESRIGARVEANNFDSTCPCTNATPLFTFTNNWSRLKTN